MSVGDWLRLEVDLDALRSNAAAFRRHVPRASRLLVVVKADGYGHGAVRAARAFLAGGADVLGVHAVREGLELRAAGIEAPVLVLGPSGREEAAAAAAAGLELTVPSVELAREAAAAAGSAAPLRVHLKVETGVNRQGIVEEELAAALAALDVPSVELVGLSSHFADIEDTTDHAFATAQRRRFDAWTERLAAAGRTGLIRHMSCSAAAVLWPDAPAEMVRVGVAAYGVWPSRETLVSARAAGHAELALKPAVTWRCRISQIRHVPAGETVGYGRAWKAPVDSRIAVLPVGYADGYPRALSGRAHVLAGGRRAPLVGRGCMNLCMVDVTHAPDVRAGDDAVLLGAQGDERITAEQMAGWLGTIPYEVLVLPGASWRRQGRD